MYEFLYDYIKPKYGEKSNLCYIDTNMFHSIHKNMIFIDVAEDIENI